MIVILPEPVDFRQLLLDLHRWGMNNAQIARAVSCNYHLITQLWTCETKNPRYELGAKLVALHKANRVMYGD